MMNRPAMTHLSRREWLQALMRGALLGGLVAIGARAATRRGDPRVRGGANDCQSGCGECGQRPICSRPEAARARMELRHGKR